jgi:hypothetical protein
VLGGEATAGQDEAPETLGNGDRKACAHQRPTTTGREQAVLDRHEVATGIAGMGVRGEDSVRVEAGHEQRHGVTLPGRTR